MFAIFLAAATASPTGITYLTCFTKEGVDLNRANFAVDEVAQRVSVRNDGATAYEVGPASFSTDTVVLRITKEFGAEIHEINRVTLEYKYSMISGTKSSSYFGSCELQKQGVRAF